ncbi:MAG: AEC family transporter [Alphaproteobacteria bacterium]|nr:AEC family transporter [Alphaproteobacteria bacterium]
MLELLGLILPVFAVVAVGYLTVRFGVVPASIAPPLVQFVYHISLPALIFHIIAGDPIMAFLNWDFWITFGGGSLLVLVLVFLVGRSWLGGDLAHRAILAFAAVWINSGFIALPILHVLFGAKGVPPAAIANMINAAILFPVLAAILETTRVGEHGEKRAPWRLARNVVLSPMVWPTVLGIIFVVFAIPVPKPVEDFLVILGSALTPCALFAIGASIDFKEMLHDIRRIVVLSMVKLFALPAVVLGIGLALDMAPFYLIAATICAAVPTAKSVFFLANEYHVAEKSAAVMISATTVAAIVTMTIWLMVLAAIYPSVFHGDL